MRVQEIMTPSPRTALPSDSVMAVAALMRAQDGGSLPNLDSAGQLQGIITDRAIAIQVVAEGRDPAEARVADSMTRNPTTIGPSADVAQAADLMAAEQIRRLPVVQNGRLVAML